MSLQRPVSILVIALVAATGSVRTDAKCRYVPKNEKGKKEKETEKDQPPTAEDPAKTEDWLDRFAKLGFSVRQGFQGIKEEKLPANLNYTDSTDAPPSWGTDLGIKWETPEVDWECDAGDGKPPWEHALYPSIYAEWHRATQSTPEVNKLIAGAKGEYLSQIGADRPNGAFVSLAFEGSDDAVKHKTSTSIVARASFLCRDVSVLTGERDYAQRWCPSESIHTSHGYFRYRYYPYVGLEYYNNLPIDKGGVTVAPAVSQWFGSARIYFEWYPFNKTDDEGQFQILVTYTFRYALSTVASATGRSFALVEPQLLYYFDKKKRAAIGYSYTHGKGPLTNFDNESKHVVALKVKL